MKAKQTKIVVKQSRHKNGLTGQYTYEVVRLLNRTVPAIGYIATEDDMQVYLRMENTNVEVVKQ